MFNKELIHAIRHYHPSAEWTVQGNDYKALIWLDKTIPKPTEQELEALCHFCDPVKLEYAALETDGERVVFLARRLGIVS